MNERQITWPEVSTYLTESADGVRNVCRNLWNMLIEKDNQINELQKKVAELTKVKEEKTENDK